MRSPLLAILLLAGCATAGPAEKPSGVELWQNHCMRCHNMRSPTELDDGQWEVAMMHMRLRANLSGDEQRAILAVMKGGR
jgi:outer membrane biogenesis lipoprotein LolB